MIPKIDQFFLDKDYGPLKFKGYDKGQFLFSTYEDLSGKWVESVNSFVLHPSKFEARLKQGELVQSFPPS